MTNRDDNWTETEVAEIWAEMDKHVARDIAAERRAKASRSLRKDVAD